ncbi:MAG: peptide chain release factor N(5)-glutamine methyltransferase [Marinomonas sp.]
MTIAQALRDAAQRLSETSDTARLDAELLMAHALDVSRSDMLLRHMDDEEPADFQNLVSRRTAREPVAYIMGYTEFYGRRFDVEPGVLIPRDDSAILIDVALEIAPEDARVLDMGTGSGALILTFLAECENALGIALDVSANAVKIAQSNAQKLGLSDRLGLLQRDWGRPGWNYNLPLFDLILCNPPYVEDDAELEPDVRQFEPSEALFAGPEGLDDYRIIIPQLGNILKADGKAILEIGHRQAEMAAEIAAKEGFSAELKHDLGGRPRCLILSRAHVEQ